MGIAVGAAGGNQLEINAADAIQVTCTGLRDSGSPLDTDQQELFDRCRDMVGQGLALTSPGAGPYGLGGDPDAYRGLLRQFSGEEVSSQGRYMTEGAASQFKGLAGRLGAIRRGLRTSGFAVNLQGTEIFASTDDSVAAPVRLAGGTASADEGDTGFAWFANVEYGFGDRDDTEFEDGYDADSWGGVIGLDYGINEALVIGGAFAYRTTEVEFDTRPAGSLNAVSGGDLESDTQTFSLFANYATAQGYASAIASYGSSDYDMSRATQIPDSTGSGRPAVSGFIESDTDSDQFGAQLQAGRTFGQGATTFDVYGGLDYLEIDVDSFAESGSALALSFGDQEIESFQGFLGATVRRAINTDAGVIVPYLTLEYRHEFDNEGRSLDARYLSTVRAPDDISFFGETDNFEIPTDDPDENFVDTSLGLAMQFGNNLVLYGQFSTLLGVEDVSASLVTLGIRGSF